MPLYWKSNQRKKQKAEFTCNSTRWLLIVCAIKARGRWYMCTMQLFKRLLARWGSWWHTALVYRSRWKCRLWQPGRWTIWIKRTSLTCIRFQSACMSQENQTDSGTVKYFILRSRIKNFDLKNECDATLGEMVHKFSVPMTCSQSDVGTIGTEWQHLQVSRLSCKFGTLRTVQYLTRG